MAPIDRLDQENCFLKGISNKRYAKIKSHIFLEHVCENIIPFVHANIYNTALSFLNEED